MLDFSSVKKMVKYLGLQGWLDLKMLSALFALVVGRISRKVLSQIVKMWSNWGSRAPERHYSLKGL